MNHEVTLLGTALPCPFVLRARIALNIRGVTGYGFTETLQPNGQLPQDNPLNERIPVLIHRRRRIYGSLVIVQYVDDAWNSGHPILPSDPYDRAVARFLATYIDEKLYPAMRSLITTAPEQNTAALVQEIKNGMGRLRDALQGRPFFGGDRIGYLDIAFGSFLGWLRVVETTIGLNLVEGSLSAWARRFRTHPQVVEVEGNDALAINNLTPEQRSVLFR